MAKDTITLGGAAGFWGESAVATPQLLAGASLDYLVYDYLAEITMSIMARARATKPEMGYAVDFVRAVMKPNLAEIAAKRVKVISNAGGVNPRACAAAVRELIAAAGLGLKVAVVEGDDLRPRYDEIQAAGVREMFSGAPLPPAAVTASMNAYLGAFPIARALDAGADIVITGRVVDSAVTLGACIHEFGWTPQDLNALAGASLAGHILECGPQATGGNFTDWHHIADNMHTIGYPIAEVSADGSFVCTKPEGTGGLVSVGTVGEQMLYEIGDPQAYVLPDVVCDFSAVQLEVVGDDRVRVSGARGGPPTDTYKVSATYADGFRGGQLLFFYGFEADQKARAFGEAVLRRADALLQYLQLGPLTETEVEVFGDESHYGAARRSSGAREVTLKIAAKHPSDKGVGVFLQETIGLALSAPPGLTMFAGGRPKPSPVVRLFSFLWPKSAVPVSLELDGARQTVETAAGSAFDPARLERPAPPAAPDPTSLDASVPLVRLAWGRSGDKGDKANIGVLARQPDYLPYIWAALTEDVVRARFAHFIEGRVERFFLPGSGAINFVLHEVLGGGGVASLRNDPQGKGYAQVLLDHEIPVPRRLAERL